MLSDNLTTAPFHDGEALTHGCRRKRLRLRYGNGAVKRLVCHKDADYGFGRWRDVQRCRVGVGCCLECDQIIGIVLHSRQPVDDEFVVFARRQSELRQNLLQKCGGFAACDAIRIGEVVFRVGDTFPEQISTICVNQVNADNIEEILQEVVEKGASIVFEVGVEMMEPSLKFAVEHPNVTILNCSLNAPHKYIRTYYARMYEAKFISGMIAGAMAENDRIAYVADYPIYGMIANINAFALGAACVNPRAKVYVDWSTRKDHDLDYFLTMNDIHYVSNQDMIRPINPTREYGLYKYENGEATNLIMPVWNWGIYYEKLIQGILAGTYKSEDEGEAKAINYWWGMSAGVIDLVYSKHVPTGVKRLAEHMEYDISVGDVVPFFGEIRAQDGTLKNAAGETMSPEDIMKMDYLVENVEGDIPSIDLLKEQAKPIVELKGVEEANEE